MQKEIWIIDDEEGFRFLHKQVIKTYDKPYRVREFVNASLALKEIINNLHDPQNLPDFVLLDLNMPVMDGWQFLDAFALFHNELPKHISIHLVSSSDLEVDIARANGHRHVAGYIPKALTLSKLEGILAEA